MSNEPQRMLRQIGNFEIISKIGQGGMGTVFKARQKSLDREVALKILPPSIAKDSTFIERFQREARASARLNHPHIVTGIDVGQDAASGLWYFAMEFVDGPTLKKVLQERGRLREDEIIKLGLEIGSALECLEANGMIHRDIKPDNIMLNQRGEAKLADLGLAKDTRDDASLTQSGRAVGTPFYMPPEQVRGENSSLDIRADIYALGATLYHLATGNPPFLGETSAVIMSKHLSEPPPIASRVVPSISEGLSRLIERMMQKSREDRIQHSSELVAALRRVEAGEYIGAGTSLRSSVRGTGARVPIKNRTTAAPKSSSLPLLLGGGALVLVAFGFFFLGNKPQEPSRESIKAKVSGEPLAVSGKTTTRTDTSARLSGAVSQKQEEPQSVAKAPATPDTTWDALTSDAAKLVESGDFDGAITKLNDAQVDATLKNKADTLIDSIKTDAERRFSSAIADIENHLTTGELGKGTKELLELEKLNYQPQKAAVLVLRNKIDEAGSRRAEQQRLTELRSRELPSQVKAVLENFEKALIEEQNPAVARTIVTEAAANKAFKDHKAILDSANEVANAFEDYCARLATSAQGFIGKPLRIGKDDWTLKEVKEHQLYFEQKGNGGAQFSAQRKVRISDLPEVQRRDVLKTEFATTPSARVAAALLRIKPGVDDYKGAAEILEGSQEFPLFGVVYDRIQIRLRGEAEVAAEKAWEGVETAAKTPLTAPAEGHALLGVLTEYTKQHGETQFAQARLREFRELRQLATKATIVNLLKNGDFEAAETVSPWVKESPNDWRTDSSAAASGKASYFAGGNGRLFQTVELELGASYQLTAKVSTTERGQGAMYIKSERMRDRDAQRVPIQLKKAEEETLKWESIRAEFIATAPKYLVGFEKGNGSGNVMIDEVVLSIVKKANVTAGADPVTMPPPATKQPVAPIVALAPKQSVVPLLETAGNVIQNGSFEEKSTGWKIDRNVMIVPEKRSGQSAIRMQNKSSIRQAVRMEEGAAYRFSCWFQGNCEASLSVGEGRSESELARQNIRSGENEWVKWDVLLEGKAILSLELSVRGENVLVDDVVLVRAPPGTVVPKRKGDGSMEVPDLLPDFHFYNGHVYRHFKELVTWAEAKRSCEKLGGHLVIVENDREDTFLKNVLRTSNKHCWMGLFDSGRGQWLWVDEKKMQYNGFSDRTGVSKTQGPRAAVFAHYLKNEWVEEATDRTNGFICEWDSVEQRFLNPAKPGQAKP